MSKIKKVIFASLVIFLVCNSIHGAVKLAVADISAKKSSYLKWLNELHVQVNKWKGWDRLRWAGMKALGYKDCDIEAVPVSYPFLLDQQYTKLIDKLTSTQFMQEINELLEAFETKCEQYRKQGKSLSDKSERRALLHKLFHERNIQQLNLDPSTSTKQLADLVVTKNPKVNIQKLCEAQLSQFFVKQYLGLE